MQEAEGAGATEPVPETAQVTETVEVAARVLRLRISRWETPSQDGVL
jgi:hypothetical protein